MQISTESSDLFLTEEGAVRASGLFGQYLSVPASVGNFSFAEFYIGAGLAVGSSISMIYVAPSAPMDFWVSVEPFSIGIGNSPMINLTSHVSVPDFGWGASSAAAISSNTVARFVAVPTTGLFIPCPVGGTLGLNTVVVWGGTINTAFTLSSRVIASQAPYL